MSSWLLSKSDPLFFKESEGTDQPLGTVEENFQFAYENDRLNEIGSSKAESYADVWGPIVDEINEKGGPLFRNPGNVVYNNKHYENRKNRIFDYVEQNQELFPELQDIRTRDFDSQAQGLAQQARDEFNELDQRSPGLTNVLAQFSGSFASFFRDPGMLVTMPAGLLNFGVKSLFGVAVREAGIGAGTEAINQIAVQKWYEELGYDYTYSDFIARVGTASAFGFTLPYTIAGAGQGVKMTTSQMKKGLQVLKGAGAPETPAMRAAETSIERIEAIEADNPLRPSADLDEIDASLEHQTRTVEADEAVLFNELPNIPDQPVASIDPNVYTTMGLPYRSGFVFDPEDLGVAPDLFQYKSGGDEFGITGKLAEEEVWVQYRSGTALVYEFADGRKVVADGHQRLGFAKKIKAQDPNQDPKIHALVYREVDGWTPEEMRKVAALKNIAEETGTAIDAAKVLRVDPDKISEMNLPKKSALVQQARGLVNLDNEIFMMAVNGVVPTNYAAIVGRMIPEDRDLQEAAMRVLASQEPSNEFQAQTMVGQVREIGAQKMTQDGLFGEETFAESFFAERAKVLDRALKEIRKDKAAFNNITKNAERLEAEGNVLEKANNERRINNEQKTLQLLQALANAKGPLSDALTAAARAARDSGSYAGPTRKFLDDVRAAVTAGDLDRLTASDVGRFVDGATESRPGPARTEPEIELFDEPTGQGVTRQADQLANDFLTPEKTSIDQGIVEMIRKSIDEFDEDAYIRLINPDGLRIPDEDVGTWTFDDMQEKDIPLGPVTELAVIDGIAYDKVGTNIYARDVDEFDGALVGYMEKAEDGSDLNVAEEYRGRGIGGQLSFLYRSQNPKMASGGLSIAGEATARAAFRKMKELSFIENDVDKYFVRTDDSIDIPVAQLTPTRARPEGVFSSKVFMARAARGEMSKRPPIEVRANEDGTYTLRDGNSTYAVAVDAGWETVPVRVLTDEEYAKAAQAKAIDRILNPGAKDKGRTVTKQPGEDNEYSLFEFEMLKTQQFKSIEDIMERSRNNHQMLNEMIEEITGELGIPFNIERKNGVITTPPIKKEEDLRRKLIDKYKAPADDPNPVAWLHNVTDVARSGMSITKPSDVKAVLDAINSDKYKLHVLDESFKVTDAGYFDAKALVQAPDGQLMELQFWPPGMLAAKESADLTEFGYPATYFDEKAGKEKPFVGGHKLYEIIQDRAKTATKEQIEKAEEDSKIIYGRVIAELKPEFYPLLDMLGIDRKSALKSSARLDASDSDISTDLSSARIGAAEPEPQTPATGFQTAANELSSEIAASEMPSTLKNLTDDTSDIIVSDLDNAAKAAELYPTGRVIENDDGELVVEMQSAAELKAEFDHDQDVLDRFRDCVL